MRSQAKASKRELHGPRPAPLKIWKDSHKIKKPPLPVPAMAYRPPVIIYTRSPEVIHTEAGDFMTLVQRLTGRVDAHGHSSVPPAASLSIHESQTCDTSLPGNPNFVQVVAPPSPPRGGPDIPLKEEDKSIPCEFSGDDRSEYSTVQSLLSPTIQHGSILSPLSPNFFLPSPLLLSPNIFHDFPLCTPQPDYFYKQLLHMQSEPIFTPHASLPSPLPTDYDLFNNSTFNIRS